AAGAVIMGKTVTTEYAAARPGKTGNPHNLNHTPGGSSSGSAAAVAAGMVPVAVGSQTLGSILRPAAYCGVLGFKPSFGTISRHGVMSVCRELDHLGLFARTVTDLQRVSAVLAVPDLRDPDCCGNAALQSGTEQPVDSAPPRLALWTTPFWPQIDPRTQQHFLNCAALLEQSGAAIAPIQLSADFADCYDDAQTLMSVGLAVNHGGDYDRHGDQLSPKLRDWIERGRQTTAIAYGRARQRTVDYSVALSAIFADYDAILMPVTTGPAPATRDDTGSPVLCALATLCGLPAISIPAGTADNGLPLAVQLMGKKYGDRDLLQIADWLHLRLQRATG
ncbi:MAG TPA: amidase, partial [Chroococcidiopsis sp.]